MTLSLFVLAAGAPACSQPIELGPQWLEVGAGDRTYVAIEDGQTLSIVAGPQGGHMIALGLRAGGVIPGDPLDPTEIDNPRATFRINPVGSEDVVGITTVQRGLTTVDENTFELVGTWLVFNPSVDTALYFERDLRVDATLVDSLGNTLTGSATVFARAPSTSAGRCPRSQQFDVDPGKIVRRPGDHAQHAAAQIDHTQQQMISRRRRHVRAIGDEAALKGNVTRLPVGRVVQAKHLDFGAVVHQEQLVARQHVGVVDAGQMQSDLSRQRVDDWVAPFDQSARAKQEVVARGDTIAVLVHVEATVGPWRR